MDNFKKLVDDIGREFIFILIKELRGGTLKLSVAKKKTKDFLALMPFKDENELVKKINFFCQKNQEFIGLDLFLRKKEEEEKTQAILKKMEKLIKLGKIDEALIVAKEKYGRG